MTGEILFVKTCDACPEQYDAMLDGVQVGYLRLRHGTFTVAVPDVSGHLVYVGHPRGDGLFEPEERDYYMRQAAHNIMEWVKEGKPGPGGPPPNDPGPDIDYKITDEAPK